LMCGTSMTSGERYQSSLLTSAGRHRPQAGRTGLGPCRAGCAHRQQALAAGVNDQKRDPRVLHRAPRRRLCRGGVRSSRDGVTNATPS
jgi:hypothetical protein